MTDKHSNDYAKHLKMLKEKLDRGAMSALIGAGFSKNFKKDIFPNWWELIYGMVREGLETELSDRYLQLFPKKKASGRIYEIWLKKRIERFIENIGPLEAVSEFIKGKGYREAVDVRIEQQTPIIEVENGDRYIRYMTKGKVVRRLATLEEFRIHRKLVQLPWNNIYTTNYDNLLENSLDITIAKEFQSEIDELKGLIADHQQNLDSQRKNLTTIKIEYDSLTDQLKRSTVTMTALPVDSGPATNADETRLNELTDEKITIEWDITRSEISLKQLDKRLADLERNLGHLKGVVTHASQLAIRKTGNIIKIHGSVRTNEDLDYGFDSDARMHYVISKEDFAGYPEKHEAFTQLMRISLLQEAFCLLGFSGIDPNFLSWIGWVRDVIERIKMEDDTREPKIYLIDVCDKQADSEKALFHLNHRITFIPLGHPDCLRFLEEEVGRNLPASPESREIVELFLDYLSTGMPSHIQIAFEQFQQERYKKLWQKSPWTTTSSDSLDNFFIFKKATELAQLRKYNRIPSNAHHLFERYDTIQALPLKLKQLKDDPKQLNSLIGFIAQLLSEQYLFVSNILEEEEDVIQELVDLAKRKKHPQYSQLLLVQLRDAVWSNEADAFDRLLTELKSINDEDIKQEIAFLETLFAFFNLRFTKAEHLLTTWESVNHWTVKKAGLLLLINPSAAMVLLKSLRLKTVQETIYQLQLLAFGSLAIGEFEQRTKYVQQYKDILHEGLNDTSQQLEYLLKKLSDKNTKIVPYGYDKFAYTRTISFGGGNEWAYSQIFFRLLADLGFPLALPRLTFYDSVKIHPSLFLAFPNMPYAVIFYLFQYSDEKLVIKLAQDYATSEKVAGDILTIYDRIQAMYRDDCTMESFRLNGLHFLSELINVIDPAVWEGFFLEVWNDLLNNESLLSERRLAKHHFIEKALHLFQLPGTAIRIVNDLLVAILKNKKPENTTSAIRFLYELNFNSTIKKLGKVGQITLNTAAIDMLTQSLAENLDLMFVLGNLNFAMSDAQGVAITKVLQQASQLGSSNERVWRIVLYFANNDSAVVQKIKTAILESSRLWDAGFTEKGRASSYNYISLYQLRKRNQNQGLTWNSEELEIIYAKLKVTLSKIEDWMKYHNEFSNFKAIAEEMSRFLNAESELLKITFDIQEVVSRVNSLMITEKNYVQLMDGLLSDVKDEVTGAINDLSYQLCNFNQFGQYALEIKTVLNRILLQTESGLAEALGRAAYWFYVYRHKEELRTYSDLLLAILCQYRKRLPDTIDQPYLETKLITISLVLKEWQINTPDVSHFLKLLKTSRFMEIRYNLKYQLDND